MSEKTFLKTAFTLVAICFFSMVCHAQTNVIYGYEGDITGQPVPYYSTAIATLLSPNPRTIGNITVQQQPIKCPVNITTGYYSFTNLPFGYYRLDLTGTQGSSFYFWVSLLNTGNVPIVSLIQNAQAEPPNPGTNYYTQAQIDALLTGVGGSAKLTNGLNTTLSTNGAGAVSVNVVTNAFDPFGSSAQSITNIIETNGFAGNTDYNLVTNQTLILFTNYNQGNFNAQFNSLQIGGLGVQIGQGGLSGYYQLSDIAGNTNYSYPDGWHWVGKMWGNGGGLTNIANAVQPSNATFANQLFVDGVSGSDVTGNGTITAPYLTFTNAIAVDVANYNNLYTIVMERGTWDLHGAAVALTNNASLYFYSGTVVTNGYFAIFQCTNTTISVVGGVSIAPFNAAFYITQISNVACVFGSVQAPLGTCSGYLIDFGGATGTDQNSTFNTCFNLFNGTSVIGGSGGNLKSVTNCYCHVTSFNPIVTSGVLIPVVVSTGVPYPYTNNLVLQFTAPQINIGSSSASMFNDAIKLILDPMIFTCPASPSATQTNILLVARDVEFTVWPTNLLINSPPNFFTNSFWP